MRKHGILCAAGLVIIVLGSCATPYSPKANYRTGRSVDVNQLASARVGEVIFSEYDYVAYEGARLVERFEDSIGLGVTKVIVPAGSRLVSSSKGDETIYCTVSKTVYDSLLGGGFAFTCFVDDNSDDHFDRYRPSSGFIMFKLDRPLPYKRFDLSIDSGGFKYELLYLGLSERTLRLSYREFTDNLARPAFQQDLTYTLADEGNTQISFRKLRIEVIAADNNQMTYKVLSGFE